MLLNRPVQHFLTVHFNTSRPITWTFSDRPLRLVTVYFDTWSSTSTSQRPLWGPFTLGSDYFFLCAIFNSWVLFQNLPRTKIYSRRVPVNGSNILYFINERINQKTIADSKWFQLRQVFNFWDPFFCPVNSKSMVGPKSWADCPAKPDPESSRNTTWKLTVSNCHFRIAPSPWELNAPIAPEEPDMDEHQSRTLQDVLGSIYSEFGFSSGVETPATSVAPSRRSSNRSSIRSVHSLKLKRKNRKELIFYKKIVFWPISRSPSLWLILAYLGSPQYRPLLN